MAMIYFSKRIQSVFSKGKRAKSGGNQAQAFKSSLPAVPKVFIGDCAHRHPCLARVKIPNFFHHHIVYTNS